ncbi:MAG TPA: 16S rRNA (guanine(966)-N(2))-methyltransferase RsmD [Microthrixaceae bacterium]|nr:16S rRNA (guanine(966)-N(2))-methyltransferase RsmD [Microthrixaceae bacterium]
MRVVAGTARGRRLITPEGNDVRPTLDRVREALFNSLGSMDALHDANVVDLFAGSGALGIEALSRGAAHVTFADTSRTATDAIEANLRTVGCADAATVLRRDAFAVLSGGVVAMGGPVDLVLADPPYAFDRWVELATALVPALADGAVVVAESDRPLGDELVGVLGGAIPKERRYGGTVVTMMTFQGSLPSLPASDRVDSGADS